MATSKKWLRFCGCICAAILVVAVAGRFFVARSHVLHRVSIEPQAGPIWCIDFSPDGQVLVFGCDDGTVGLWDVRNQKTIGVLKGHRGAVRLVAFSPDGRTLASGSEDHTVRLWNVALAQAKTTLQGHVAPIKCVAFSRINNSILASASDDGTVRLWDSRTGKETRAIADAGLVSGLAFAPKESTLASASIDGRLSLWDPETGLCRSRFRGETKSLISLAFAPDGKTLATGNLLWKIQLWDIATGNEEYRIDGHYFPVCSLSFSPDGNRLASASWGKSSFVDPEAKIWDLRSRKLLVSLTGHKDGITAVTRGVIAASTG